MIGVLICANLQVVLQCHLKITWQFEWMLSYWTVQRWSLESTVTKNCTMEDKETLNKPFWRIHLKKKPKQGLVFIPFIFFVKLKTFCSFYRTGQLELEQWVKARSMITKEEWHTRLPVCNSYLSQPSLNNHTQRSWCMFCQVTVQISSSVAYSCCETIHSVRWLFLWV